MKQSNQASGNKEERESRWKTVQRSQTDISRILRSLRETDLVTATSQWHEKKIVGWGEIYIEMNIKDKQLNVICGPGLDLDLEKKHV